MIGKSEEYNTFWEILGAVPFTVSNSLITLPKRNLEIVKGKTMKNRTLKLQEAFRDYVLKRRALHSNRYGNATTAKILLKGTWLEKAGFTIGTPVTVIVEENRLVLVPRSQL